MNAKTTVLAAAVLAAALGTTAIPASAAVIVDVAPPAARVEAVPAPRAGYIWTPGYWNYVNHRHVWVAGTWVRDRPGYVYHQPAWVQRDNRWVLERGAWARGDRDHDGVPNRVDTHPNNPYRP
ncbi:MAG: YXWGXW repeat-containing protein [Proteobacteria bacterium]|nr:YXWGXW repeat-containing protein [Pseudomonadota bacterium]